MKKILIVGSTGTIGRQVADLSEQQGMEVIHASRSSSPSINIEEKDSLLEFFEKCDPLDAIVCAAGNASFGKFQEQDEENIELGINSKLLGQVHVVKYGLEKLNPGGRIILTGGMLAYAPWPETSNIAMVNAGLEGFVKAIALESDSGKKVAIVHPPLVKETAEKIGMDGSPWPSASNVAYQYLHALNDQTDQVVYFVRGYEPQ